MGTDYDLIRKRNEEEYGKGIGRYGKELLAQRYAERAHFIFELLQNAEDAMALRRGWNGSRAITFHLSDSVLRVSHYGNLFDETDVRGICGIAEGTKEDLTSIGRFGIGFKSVYAFTDRPEIHSGDEHFAIDSFVLPSAVAAIPTKPEETVFILPLRRGDTTAANEIRAGLEQLGPRTLLFLREIDEIAWSAGSGVSGRYRRSKPVRRGKNARQVVVTGEQPGKKAIEETWLVFSREVHKDEYERPRYVEVAFQIVKPEGGGTPTIQPTYGTGLVAYFPTIVETNLGFLVQGPYRTTPSRDNVPQKDSWNKRLVRETAKLLVEALHALRRMGLLNVDALLSLPLDSTKFPEGSRFRPLFDAVRKALSSDPLLPKFGGGYVSGKEAVLARTQQLRDLLSPDQIFDLFRKKAWIGGEITENRAPELYKYLSNELRVPVIDPETTVRKLTKQTLEKQEDGWIRRLYEFLNQQRHLLRSRVLDDVPLLRLEDGTHIKPRKNDQPQAFLPGKYSTDFPTVRRSVCSTSESREMLKELGLTEPDAIDDVIKHVLPRYKKAPGVTPAQYDEDIERILNAFGTDSRERRKNLIEELRAARFVAAVDAGTGSKLFAKPDKVYLRTEKLSDLFDGVPGVLLVDASRECLRKKNARDLLEACGVSDRLRPIPVPKEEANSRFDYEARRRMRKAAGCEDIRGGESIEDYTLLGLEEILSLLPKLSEAQRKRKAGLLWETLCDLEPNDFSGTYKWFYVTQRSCRFDARFVDLLNETAWIPGEDGVLRPPAHIFFERTGWKENQFLLSKVHFKPTEAVELAQKVGIELGVLDLLKDLGLTTVAEFTARLGIVSKPPVTLEREDSAEGVTEVADETGPSGQIGHAGRPEATSHPEGVPTGGTSPVNREITTGKVSALSEAGAGSAREDSGSTTAPTQLPLRGASVNAGSSAGIMQEIPTRPSGVSGPQKAQGSTGGHPLTFISYLAASPDEEEDPDGLSREERDALEDKAIELILKGERNLKRMPPGNPGFDLYEPGPDGKPIRWVEVKAMTRDLKSRPVGISRTQFDCAVEHGAAFWLYVVEHAGNPDQARILGIQDPASKVRTFAFDRGWLKVAKVIRGSAKDG